MSVHADGVVAPFGDAKCVVAAAAEPAHSRAQHDGEQDDRAGAGCEPAHTMAAAGYSRTTAISRISCRRDVSWTAGIGIVPLGSRTAAW